MKIGSAVRPGRVTRKKDRRVKKSQSGNISPIWGEAPTEPNETKICMVGSLPDIITGAKFQVEIFRDYDFTGGSNFPFSY